MTAWWNAFRTTLLNLLERPMWLMLIISLTLMGAVYMRGSVWDLPVAVIDKDHSFASRLITRNLDATPKMQAINYDNFNAALHDLGWRKLFAVIILPQDLEQKILAGKAVTIPVYGDATNRLAGGQIQMNVSSAYQEMLVHYQKIQLQMQGIDPAMAQIQVMPVIGQTSELFNPGIGFAAIIFPGLLIMLCQHTLLLASIRVNLTLRAKGRVPVSVSLGTLSALIPIWLFLALILFILCPWILGYRQTAPVLEILLLTFPFLLAVLGLGKLLTECFGRTEHIYLTLPFVTTPVYYLSGTIFPLQSMPLWVNFFSHLLPSTWAVQIIASVNQMGLAWHYITLHIGVLLLMGGGYTLLGVMIRRWRIRRSECP
ncbi:ABC transporter permease [Enterobacteriaceae bacterium LUAb1]